MRLISGSLYRLYLVIVLFALCIGQYGCTDNISLQSNKRDGKWGFVDIFGREVIGFQYDNANDFREGLAAVQKNGKWGYIDKNGQEVIALQYDYAFPFDGSFASVKQNDEYFYIDKQGNRMKRSN